MALLQATIIGLIALALTPGWLFYFDVTPKIALLLAGTAAALFCTGRAPRWFSLLLLANLLSLTVSTALSSNPALSLFGTTSSHLRGRQGAPQRSVGRCDSFRNVSSRPSFALLELGRMSAPFDHLGWIYELKYDGFRARADVS